MNTNHCRKNNEIFDALNDFFSKKINKVHIRLICVFIIALCKAKTACFGLSANCFDSSAKAESCLRRIQRFFAEFDLNHDLIARFLYKHLPGKGRRMLATSNFYLFRFRAASMRRKMNSRKVKPQSDEPP